jgi:hypothetical protein
MRALAFALALLAQPLAAETRQHGNVLFDIPDGFGYGKIGPTGTLSVWADHDLDACPACEVLIGAGAVAEGPVDAFLAANTRRLIDPWDSPTVEPVEGIGTFLLQNRYPAAFQQQWVGERFQILFAIEVGDRMELVAFETPFIDQATMDRAMQTYDGPIRRMIDGLSFVSDGARPLIGAPEPGALYGVWWNARYWSTVNWDGTMTTHNQHRWLTFYPDGRFYDGTPPAGTAPLDPARLYAEGDMGWGNYRLEGSDLTLSFASGAVEALQFDGTTLKTEYLTLNPVQLYADGIAVEGRVDSFSYVAFGAISGMTGGTTSASEAIFRADGTWTGTDASATGGMLDVGGGFASDRSTTVSGRYEVKNGLLLTYDDQGRLYGSEYLFQDKDGTIWVGTETLD